MKLNTSSTQCARPRAKLISNLRLDAIRWTQQRQSSKAEGHIKDGVGKLTGNEKLQAEGKMDKAEGEVRKKGGDVKDAFKKK
jgi:uncharacterized protein YjbJ (UPF0337 family)